MSHQDDLGTDAVSEVRRALRAYAEALEGVANPPEATKKGSIFGMADTMMDLLSGGPVERATKARQHLKQVMVEAGRYVTFEASEFEVSAFKQGLTTAELTSDRQTADRARRLALRMAETVKGI